MVLSDPPRVVIDIQSTNLGDNNIASDLSFPGVKSFRIAQRRGAIVRIVIETDQDYNCRTSQPMSSQSTYAISLPKANGELPTISQITQENISRHAEEQTEEPSSDSYQVNYRSNQSDQEESTSFDDDENRLKLSTKSEDEEKGSFLSSIFGSFSSSSATKLKKNYTVVVDAGHGGHDSGAIGSAQYYEKVVVLQIAKKVNRFLKKKNLNVQMTRNNDHFVDLKNRTKFANRHKADIFVSIHANAIANKQRFNLVYGVETYFLQTTRSAKSMRIAATENSVVLNKNDFLSNNVILQAVLSGPKIELSHKLAIDVQTNILKSLRQKYRGVRDGGVKPAPFWVLVGAQMPSILVEVGYITNPAERARLFSSEYQNHIAKGIADGIANYLYIREREFN